VAKDLAANPPATMQVFNAFTEPSTYSVIGYIVVQHIELPDCNESDVELIAQTVQRLIGVKAPDSVPGSGCAPLLRRLEFAYHVRDSGRARRARRR